MARPSIQAAVEKKRQQSEKPTPPMETLTLDAAALPIASREGKVNVSAYFPPEVKSSLRMVQAKRGGKVQDLLAEALNLLFAKYNVPETAPINEKHS